jgi:hypothetical protein
MPKCNRHRQDGRPKVETAIVQPTQFTCQDGFLQLGSTQGTEFPLGIKLNLRVSLRMAGYAMRN